MHFTRRSRSAPVVVLLGLSLMVLASGTLWSQTTNRDPDAARLISTDILSFWRVFDRLSSTDAPNAADSFQREYLDAGSAGLRDFTSHSIHSGRELAAAVAAHSRYYTAIRANTLAVERTPGIKDAIHAAFRNLKALYPAATFPDVYFVIGRLSSGGTTSSSGMLIGLEMNARDSKTPIDELSSWERAVTGQLADVPYIVAHELIHIQQGDPKPAPTLLEAALREGSADFVGELISRGHANRLQRSYGDAHERMLWEEFSTQLRGTDLSRWLYQGNQSVDRPADLGYYVGYKICEAFYQRASDKPAAVAHILRAMDADAFLRESGYAAGVR
jgi:hypothetical protein